MESYETRYPTPQNAFELFGGEWTSSFPVSTGVSVIAGTMPLCVDPRITWAIDALGGVNGKRVLELGPLEGSHTYMLEHAGAREVTAIEGNKRAYLRCLVVKETLRLQRSSFLCGNFATYLNETTDTYDAVFACGVLYHQIDPMQMLIDIARVAPAVFLWTHYYDAERIAANPSLEGKCGPLIPAETDGRAYHWAEFRYLRALDWAGFTGGLQPIAHWLPRNDILSALTDLGLSAIEISFDEPDHPNGPAFALVAQRPQ